MDLHSLSNITAQNEYFEGENQVYIRIFKMFGLKECLKSPSPNLAFF